MPSPRRAAWALALLIAAGCAHGSSERRAGPLRIVATTSTLASLARGAAGPGADIHSLVPVGVSPEDFQPSPDSIAALRDADVLVENGVGLESWLDPTIRNSGNPHLRIVDSSHPSSPTPFSTSTSASRSAAIESGVG